MEEQRNPFAGGGAVIAGTADQLQLAVQFLHQPTLAEIGDDLAFVVELWKPVFEFHALSIIRALGQRLSK